jgi:adenylate cyclase
MMRDAQARAEATGHPPTIIFTTSNLLRIGQLLDDHAIVAGIAPTMRALGDRLGSRRFTAYALLAEGWLHMQESRADGFTRFREGWEIMTACHHITYAPYSAQQVAAATLRRGDVDAARDTLDEAFALLERTEARWCEAELHRTRGEIAAAVAGAQRPRSAARLRSTADAANCFRRAIDVAANQGARWWELRAWFSLARLLPASERAEAMQHLRDLHAAIDADNDVAELRAVRDFLA